MGNKIFVPPARVVQEVQYGEFAYGQHVYPEYLNDPSFEFLPSKVVFLNYRSMNDSAYYLEPFITSDKKRFTKIELKWNYVKNAVIYAIYKGLTEGSMSIVTYTKENFWFDKDALESGYYYQIAPLFKPGGTI